MALGGLRPGCTNQRSAAGVGAGSTPRRDPCASALVVSNPALGRGRTHHLQRPVRTGPGESSLRTLAADPSLRPSGHQLYGVVASSGWAALALFAPSPDAGAAIPCGGGAARPERERPGGQLRGGGRRGG